MLPTTNLTQTDQTAAVMNPSMLIAAYRYQVQTIRDRLAGLPDYEHPHLCAARDVLAEAEDYLSLYLDTINADLVA